MSRRIARILPLLALAVTIGRLDATGFYGPTEYLDNGGKNVEGSPEFYWELEVKRLAKDFVPKEKRVPAPAPVEQVEANEESNDPREKMTADIDVKDFAAALKEGLIKPDDAAKAVEQHEAARSLIAETTNKSTEQLADEFKSEFADYHRGAFAYRLGKWEEAREAWNELLERPKEERRYRTVWAAFMLGKTALKTGNYLEAAKQFQLTRQFAAEGYPDTLGMAADSYGWEGRAERKQDHAPKAARLFLTQLALGDESAIVSLKALVPDRPPVDGMLNYGLELPAGPVSEETRQAREKEALRGLEAAATDPLLRRLVTAHILATESNGAFRDDISPSVNRCARWLSVIDEAHLGRLDDSEYLGWVAYTDGKYEDAAQWLQFANSDSPAACWLRAKLQRRAGKLDDAAKSMAQATESIQRIKSYTGWQPVAPDPKQGSEDYKGYPEEGSWSFEQAAGGDLGALQLMRADFAAALDSFFKGNLANDAAFVAERILSADELKSYVDKLPAISGSPTPGETGSPLDLRYLLGRRLVREDRYAEASRYLKPPYDKILEIYVKALNVGADDKRSRIDRARAWFGAAWLARYDGMELMATEGAPDGFALEGQFEFTDLAKERQAGVYQTNQFENGAEKTVSIPILIKATKPELQRLAKNRIAPDVRFHYRVIAAALAMRAAQLLPDNSEELADAINTAGLWVKDREEKIGDRYYQILKTRCAKTKIGRDAIAKRWFVDTPGSWSTEQKAAYEKIHADLGIGQADR